MRLSLLRNSALVSLLGWSTAQSTTSSWGDPFTVALSTDSLLSSAQQPLTNAVESSTSATGTGLETEIETTGLAPAISVTDAFSTTLPTELSTLSSSSSSSETSRSASASASASASVSASVSSSGSSRGASSSASSTGSGAATQSTAAAAPGGVQVQQRMMGVAGVLAGAAGVFFT